MGVEVSLQSLVISVLDGGEFSGSRPGRLTTGRKPTVPTVRVDGWVQELEKRKISCRGSMHGSSVVSLQPAHGRHAHSSVPCWTAQFLQSEVLQPAAAQLSAVFTKQNPVCPSVCDLVSASKPFVRFSLNSVLESLTTVTEQCDGQPSGVAMNACCTCHTCCRFWANIWYRKFPLNVLERL